MPKFTSGVVRFQNEVFPQNRELFEKLSLGQTPEALFITCSDSRIQPAMITQSEPGELFICRNAGNIVPPHTTNTGGITASIEYAVAALQVPNIVVCGHTECAAVRAAMNPEDLKNLPHVATWLSYARAAVSVVEEIGAGKSPEERLHLLMEQNVVLQLRHLQTHPAVAARLAKGSLKLHGWVYNIRTGRVTAYDEDKKTFVAVEDFYVETGDGCSC